MSACRPGDEVVDGAPAGLLYDLEHPGAAPDTVRFPAGGLVAGRHARGGVDVGAVLYWVVRDTT